MTTRDHARPLSPSELERGADGERRLAGGLGDADSLADRLAAAREAKGVDLLRAERETKIRRSYLAAMERGDWAAMPAPVYARGFLRNYATYLGLDADEILEQWQRDATGIPAEPVLVVPRGLPAPRKGLVVSPGIFVGALVLLVAAVILTYIGFQLVRYNQPPALTVTDPANALATVAEDATQYGLRGVTAPRGVVTIQASGRADITVTAGSDGAWLATVELRRGQNRFLVSAMDPTTGKPAVSPIDLVITVPYNQVAAPDLTVDSPSDSATFQNGAIPISGKAANATSVVASAAYVGVSPGQPAAGPSTPSIAPPSRVTLKVADDGSFNGNLNLTAGRWAVTVTASSEQAKTTAVTRSVTVVYQGVNLVVSIKGGRAWLKVWVDDQLASQTGSGGRTFGDGQTLTFSGQRTVEVRTGDAGVTLFTLNGTQLGTLGSAGAPQTWRFAASGQPKRTDRTN